MEDGQLLYDVGVMHMLHRPDSLFVVLIGRA